MTRDEAILRVLAAMTEAQGAVFASNGNNSRACHALGDRPLTFYAMGCMGHCAPLAAGFSSATGRPTAALDGDGSVAMGLAGLALVTATAQPPFLHVTLDNGLYETTGGQRVPVPDGLLTAAARGAGYDRVVTAHDGPELDAALRTALEERQTAFIRVLVNAGEGQAQHPRVPLHPREITDRFTAAAAGIR